MSEDASSIAEQHPMVVDLTQSFGESSEKMVSTHLSNQQDEGYREKSARPHCPPLLLLLLPLLLSPTHMSAAHRFASRGRWRS
jgi:hypothetical protein